MNQTVPQWQRCATLAVFVALLLNWFIWYPQTSDSLGGAAINGYAAPGIPMTSDAC